METPSNILGNSIRPPPQPIPCGQNPLFDRIPAAIRCLFLASTAVRTHHHLGARSRCHRALQAPPDAMHAAKRIPSQNPRTRATPGGRQRRQDAKREEHAFLLALTVAMYCCRRRFSSGVSTISGSNPIRGASSARNQSKSNALSYSCWLRA